jgi:hypothetical protein
VLHHRPEVDMVATPHETETTQATTQASGDPELRTEGEGSRTAARRYDEHVESAAKDEEHVEELAGEAEKALEGPEGNELRQADERGNRSEHK